MAGEGNELVETYRGCVTAWECDLFGHLNIAFYVERFADAAADLLERYAPGRPWRIHTVDTRYEHELRAGEGIAIRSGIIALDDISLRLGHEGFNTATGERTTVVEQTVRLDGEDAGEWPVLRPVLVPAVVPWAGPVFRPVTLPQGQGPIASGRDRVKPWELDDTGELSLLGYLHRFSNACLQVLDAIGMSDPWRRSAQRGYATFDTRLELSGARARGGDGIVVTSGALDTGNSSLRMLHKMTDAASGRPLAQFYQAGANFDLVARRSAPLPQELRERAATLRYP